MAFKKEIISRRRADLEPDCEIMVCDMQVSNVKKIAIVLCYRPPSFNSELFCSAINSTLEAVHNEYDNVCVIGDFNFSSYNWTDNYNMSTLGSGGGNLFRNTMLEFGHTQ